MVKRAVKSISRSVNIPDPCRSVASGGAGVIGGARGPGASCALGDVLLVEVAVNRVPLPLDPSCARGKGAKGRGRDR